MAKAGIGTITLSGGATLQTNGDNSDSMGLSNNLIVATARRGTCCCRTGSMYPAPSPARPTPP